MLDVSGSMSDNDRIDIARQAAQFVVDSLSMFDYFAVVTFDDKAYNLGTNPSILLSPFTFSVQAATRWSKALRLTRSA